MLFSLFKHLSISNALRLKEDQSISFTRFIMVSLILTIFLLGYLVIIIHNVYYFYVNPPYYSFSILFLILILPLICLILFHYKLDLIAMYSIISVNISIILLVFNIAFSLSCLLINNFVYVDSYIVLSNYYNPMYTQDWMNEGSTYADNGGSGGGPSSSHIPVAPQQDNSNQTQDNQTSVTNPPLANQYNYSELGNKIDNKVYNILAERHAAVNASPFNPSGKRARISEIVTVSDLGLTKGERTALKELVNSPNFPTQFEAFKNTCNSKMSNASVHSRTLEFNLINYIKTVQ